jgi:hypothetical protein
LKHGVVVEAEDLLVELVLLAVVEREDLMRKKS